MQTLMIFILEWILNLFAFFSWMILQIQLTENANKTQEINCALTVQTASGRFCGVMSPQPMVNMVVEAQYNENAYWTTHSPSFKGCPSICSSQIQQQLGHSPSIGQVLSEMQKKPQEAILQSMKILTMSKTNLKKAFVLRFRSKEEIIDFSILNTSGIFRQNNITMQRQEIGSDDLSRRIQENQQIMIEVMLKKSNTNRQRKQLSRIYFWSSMRMPYLQKPVFILMKTPSIKITMAGTLMISKKRQLSSESLCFSSLSRKYQRQLQQGSPENTDRQGLRQPS